MDDRRAPSACLLVIGNEVLSGRTRDANIQVLAQGLECLGIRLAEARVIPDDHATIVDAVNDCRANFDLLFTSSGIGPTHDDITAAAVAAAFGVSLHRHPEALSRLHRHYKPEDLNPARLKMADIPDGAELIDNPVSQAPGFRIGNVYVMAGVPRIFQAMFDGVKGGLPGGVRVTSRSVAAFLPEGSLAGPLAQVQADHPELDIGSYPFVRDFKIGASLVVRGADPSRVDAALAAICSVIRDLGGEPIFDDGTRMEGT